MRFLHAADIHLDSPLAGLARRGAIPPEVTRDCTRRAFTNLVDLARDEDVAFVLIAGDLYDADWKDFSTGLFFAAEMRRLGRPCILIHGNHDAASVLTKRLEPQPNVHVMSSHKVDRHELPGLGVVIHGRSFPNRAVLEDMSAAYPPAERGMFNIGLLHSSAEDPGAHQTYAPCSLAALAAKGYDYWALGHIHQRAVLQQRPWIVFPGNIQGRHVRETGAKGCTLVTVENGSVAGVAHRPLDVLRWAQVGVDLGGAETLTEAAARLRQALDAAAQEADGRPLIARLSLTGATRLHPALLADPDALDGECRNAAAAVSADLHVEQVRLATSPPAQGMAADALAQLAEPFHAALDDADITDALLAEFRRLRQLLPSQSDADLPDSVEALRALLPEAWQIVAHGLAGSDAA